MKKVLNSSTLLNRYTIYPSDEAGQSNTDSSILAEKEAADAPKWTLYIKPV